MEEGLWHLLGHSLEHSIEDTLVLIPFLFVTYLAMEALEHGAAGFSERVILKAGKAGPVVGALLGALPQCGFSAMGATLYSARVVTVGTLVAVILSTSDEMLPVFVANGAPVSQIAAILAFKVIVGMVAGLVVDLAVRVLHIPTSRSLRIHEMCERDHCGCDGAEELAERVYEDDGNLAEAEAQVQADDVQGHRCPSCGHDLSAETCGHNHHGHSHGHGSIWRSALVHTVQVTAFIFVITFVLEVAIEAVGTDVFAAFMLDHPRQAVFYAGLVGLIPNCAASVLISELFLEGALGSGAMICGLLVGAGVGLLVLFRANRPMRSNFAIVAVLYVVAVVCGLCVNASGFAF
ncbi:putative manganese transporter [Atopobiaceae bacterium 24-176]